MHAADGTEENPLGGGEDGADEARVCLPAGPGGAFGDGNGSPLDALNDFWCVGLKDGADCLGVAGKRAERYRELGVGKDDRMQKGGVEWRMEEVFHLWFYDGDGTGKRLHDIGMIYQTPWLYKARDAGETAAGKNLVAEGLLSGAAEPECGDAGQDEQCEGAFGEAGGWASLPAEVAAQDAKARCEAGWLRAGGETCGQVRGPGVGRGGGPGCGGQKNQQRLRCGARLEVVHRSLCSLRLRFFDFGARRHDFADFGLH